MSLALTHLIGFGVAPAGSAGTSRPWNSADKGANITLSNADYDATGSGATWNGVRCTAGFTAGKIFWEVTLTALSSDVLSIPGIANGSASMTTYLGNSASSAGLQSTNPIIVNGVTRDYATAMPTFAVNDRFSFALDRDGGKLYVARNGTYFNSGDPAGGTGSVVSAISSGTWYPAASSQNTSQTLRLLDGSAAAPLVGSVPSGFTALHLA